MSHTSFQTSDPKTPFAVLLIGSGGREHALAFKLSQSPLCAQLYIASGNPGTAQHGENVVLNVQDHSAVIRFCQLMGVGLVVIGPEVPLVAGLVDDLTAANIPAFGPTKAAAQLEGSKGFTKALCHDYGIPTAGYASFNNEAAAHAYVRERGAPIVIKADGLAAGKGVVVAMTLQEALDAVTMMFEGGMGDAGSQVVIEDYLEGEEASFFAVSDGITAIPFGTAQDHKRVGDGDVGPNTGGMGAYSPAPIITPEMSARVMKEIIEPTLKGMQDKGTPYVGVLYAGLMLTKTGPQLIEYNARFGDPECQVLMPRLQSDLVLIMHRACYQRLNDTPVVWSGEVALTVVMATKGYPASVPTGSVIKGVEKAEQLPHVRIFHAGTQVVEGVLQARGGRVLNVTALGATVKEAQSRAYAAVDQIDWSQGFCRRDIGWRAVDHRI
jgi:phosphoribosylamine---glycine ligase